LLFSSLILLASECCALDSSELGGDEKPYATKWGKFAMSRMMVNLARLYRLKILNSTIGGQFESFLLQDAR
jgi:hypothetical protein